MANRGEKISVPMELSEIVRESSGEPSRHCFAKNLQVRAASAAEACRASSLTCVGADCTRKEGAGGGVLFEGLRAADGPKGLTVRDDAPFLAREPGLCWYRPGVAGPVLAFDIETTGLRECDSVTCVCAYDPDRGVEFSACTPDGRACEEFLQLLDAAPLLCAFNGVRFDVPFLARRWGVPRERVGRWVCKLVDPYEACRSALGVTFSLDRVLEANGVPCKTGSGLQAVEMAREGRWADLAEYCMHDTKKTHALLRLGEIALPRPVCQAPQKRPCKTEKKN